MLSLNHKNQRCSLQAARAQSGIAIDVLALRRKRVELELTDATLLKETRDKLRHELYVLKRSLLEPMRLQKKAVEFEKELVSNPSVDRVKKLDHLARKRKEDFQSLLQMRYEERVKAIDSGLNQILDELKENPKHDVDSLSNWFSEKFKEFPMEEDIKEMITLVNFDELKAISVLSFCSCKRSNYYGDVIQKFANKDAIQAVAQLEKEKEDEAEMAEILKEEQENGEAIKAWRQAYCVLEDAVNTVNQIENKILLKKNEILEKGQEYHHVLQKINRSLIVIALYDREFEKRPELLDKPMTEVAKIWKKPTKMVVEQKPVFTNLCSVNDLLSAMRWLSTGLDGMFREINPIVFVALLTSTFTSSVCKTGASTKLFEFIGRKLKTGGITRPDADSKARICRDSNECIACMNCANSCTLLKFGPNGMSSIMYHDSTDRSDSHLHCKLNDGAMNSITVGVASLNEYGLFSMLLYICQLMEYLYSGNTKMIGVKIDHNKVRDVTYLLSTLFQKYLPTHPILAILVKKYQIPVDILNPIDPTDIATALREFLNITEEEGHDQLSQIYTEYKCKAEKRLKATNRRFTQSCDWENSFSFTL